MRRAVTTTLATASVVLAVMLSGCQTTEGTDKDALPQADSTSTSAKTPATKKKKEAPAKPKASSCDVAREAILTGSQAQINKAMKALVADKSADATAREYARYYIGRDKGDKDMREMDVSLIQTACML